ncbi:diaminopimelate epimerase [Solimonas soli]|uniref:diaminopimelate epimerase n=1 Tax=Solimonas soli TaxID=413479 RepID=UPI0004806F48|nr:diaminopimelate epimerase [Solimonas soli]
MKLPFTKMHGAGNDFVVIDATRVPFRAEPALLRRLTDRRFGVGCDQVLVIESPSTSDVDFDYRIFNADGSEVGQCGNGSRALARFVREHGLSPKSAIRVRTQTSVLELRHVEGNHYRVDMGVPRFAPRDIPLAAAARADRYTLYLDGLTLDGGESVEIGAVNIGNPHAVLRVADVDHAPVGELGPRIQRHGAFPQGVNVGFLQVVDRGYVRLRVYERGAGETLACGSGACAAVVIGRVWGLLDASVEVQVRGGRLTIEWQGEGQPVLMTGPAETVFEGELEWPS